MDIEREKNPNCPYCYDKLIPTSYELQDGSGWMVGWTCNCLEIMDLEQYLKEKEKPIFHIQQEVK